MSIAMSIEKFDTKDKAKDNDKYKFSCRLPEHLVAIMFLGIGRKRSVSSTEATWGGQKLVMKISMLPRVPCGARLCAPCGGSVCMGTVPRPEQCLLLFN